MKKFISNLFIFFIIVFLFNVVVFEFANDNYYKGYKEVPSKKFHSLLMADSHGLPLNKLLEKHNTYNFSASSESYLDIKRKILYLIENKYEITRIYITVDRYSLSPYRDTSNNEDKSIIFSTGNNFHDLKERFLKYYFPIFQPKINPVLKMYLKARLKGVLIKDINKKTTKLWSKLPESEQIKWSEVRVRGQFSSKNKSLNLEKTLLEIINLCKTNGIELIGIKFPVSHTYLKIVGHRNYGADQLFISNGLKVIDSESIFINNDEYFGDQDHLNKKGGEAFVKELLK